MIKYRLVCDQEHEFEGWFQSSAQFDAQSADGRISCVVCGTTSVSKAIMAPSIATGRGARDAHDAMRQLMQRIRSDVESNAEYVGDRFAEEARRIHFEEEAERRIWGEASRDDVVSLIEDGVPVLPLPPRPDDQN